MRDNDNRYRKILENSYDLILEVDSTGKILYVTPHCRDIVGFDQSEIVGKSAFEFVHPDDISYVKSVFYKAVNSMSTDKAVYRSINKSGSYQWFECTGNPYVTEDGDIRGVIISRDITDRRATEYELTALNNVMETVHKFLDLQEVYDVALDTIIQMENIDMAIVYLVDQHNENAILQAHRKLPDAYLERASTIPRPIGITWKVINSGEILNIENAQDDPDIGKAGKDLGHHSLLGIPISSNERTIGVIWFLSYKERIFTEREVKLFSAVGSEIALAIANAKVVEELRSTQEQLIQSEKLASIGRLISSIAHEINNPLTPILGYSDMLLKRPEISNDIRNKLEQIHSSAERVFRVIDKLLSFSRKHVPLRTTEDINRLIEQSLEFREYQLKLANIELIRDYDMSLPKTMVDPNQLQQVFTNIVLNAEQAIIDSGVSSGKLEISTALSHNNMIEISFTDNGSGIESQNIGKVFDPFFTTKQPGKGTGLGLSVAYGIIKKHGGDIHVKIGESKNTTFVIRLPVCDKNQRKPDKLVDSDKGELNAVTKKRVLIVEDEQLISDLLRGVLERENQVDLASDGEEALSKVESGRYDLIVCDIKMPGLNGTKFYESVKHINPMLANKFVFITGDPSPETMKFLNRAGNPFVIKPFKINQFMSRANEIFA